MQRHPHSMEVVCIGCLALQALLLEKEGGGRTMQPWRDGVGAVERLVAAMGHFSELAIVQLRVVRLFLLLAVGASRVCL